MTIKRNVLKCPFLLDIIMCSGVRLVGSLLNNTGRLEINYSGVWGTVCDDLFESRDAAVVCNSLGFGLVYMHWMALYESRFLVVNVTAKFQQEHRERGAE